MAAVAVWNARPSADELLKARLARGYEPVPTLTKEGPKILGYAACVLGERAPEGFTADMDSK